MPPAPPCTDRSLHILAAEDVAINREILQLGLAELGHRVEFAVNGAETLEKLQGRGFDLVLMDMQMPVLDGVEATRRIRMLAPPLCDVPIVGLTANVLASDHQACLSAGMNECLTKPIDWERLAATIVRYGRRTATVEVLDTSQLDSLRALVGDAELGRLLSRALASLRDASASLASQGDVGCIRADAHRIKGTAGTIGMAAVGRTAAAIESAAAEGRVEQRAIARLQADVDEARAALAAAGFRP